MFYAISMLQAYKSVDSKCYDPENLQMPTSSACLAKSKTFEAGLLGHTSGGDESVPGSASRRGFKASRPDYQMHQFIMNDIYIYTNGINGHIFNKLSV